MFMPNHLSMTSAKVNVMVYNVCMKKVIAYKNKHMSMYYFKPIQDCVCTRSCAPYNQRDNDNQ